MMTSDSQLRENTRLPDKTFPFHAFDNGNAFVAQEQNVLFLHWHEHLEMIIMREGSAVFHIDSEPYDVRTGDILIVPSGALHVGYCLADGPVRYVSVVFSPALFQEFSIDPVYRGLIRPLVDGQPLGPSKLDSGHPDSLAAQALLESACREYEDKKPDYRLAVKANLLLLFIRLSRLAPARVQPSDAPRTRDWEPFKRLIRHVADRCDERMSVGEAAARVNMSVFHFCKTFKKATGRTFVDYVNLCKIEKADRLLQESGLSVTEIADAVGCGNPNYFTKLYKQYRGMPPSRARKRDIPK
ncbi:AraC family transcriptional regulator [Cohnella suwonensis]|uniref:AraC family transcriptional regulator n=1 Tax=Cohnella suwonensis TaxID=696072 RepID=A0ABW0LQN6_9BACL